MAPHPHTARPSALRRFLDAQTSSGLMLMGAAALALILVNSSVGAGFESLLHAPLGPLSAEHWINDGLMAIFFLLVGLEIKRETLDGQLATWSRRALPGLAAAGGMLVPALIYLFFNQGATARGWAIPAATDIAFALGVMSLLGNRAPASLRVFLTALAIIDDLGAVLIIAAFYTSTLSLPDLLGAAVLAAVLFAMNRLGVRRLSPYLLLGAVLWVLTLRSGIHATVAGVVLALAIPLRPTPGHPDDETASPLHRLEHLLQIPVGFIVVPIFGLANAGVKVVGLDAGAFLAPVTVGVGLGLLLGKVAGVLAFSWIAMKLRLAEVPAYANRTQFVGTAVLCGIGFTMSLFITLLAFPADELLQAEAKLGILGGSLVAGVVGYMLLRLGDRSVARAGQGGKVD